MGYNNIHRENTIYTNYFDCHLSVYNSCDFSSLIIITCMHDNVYINGLPAGHQVFLSVKSLVRL